MVHVPIMAFLNTFNKGMHSNRQHTSNLGGVAQAITICGSVQGEGRATGASACVCRRPDESRHKDHGLGMLHNSQAPIVLES